MSETSPKPYLTIDEYLRSEEHSKVRREYVDGHVFAMSGSTDAHNVICVNMVAKLHAHLRGTGCRVYSNDMKVHVKAANSFYYPDIMVTCEPFAAKSVFKFSPVLIVEILSPSTRQIDRREKLVAYRKLESLQEYVVVHQHKALLEVYCKVAGNQWQVKELRRSDELSLQSLPRPPLRFLVDEIYESVDLPLVVEEETEEYELAT